MILYHGKVDLDVAAALAVLRLAGVEVTEVHSVRPGQSAPPEVLTDSDVICLECGGAGQTDLLNFDHHGPEGRELPCATAQVLEKFHVEFPPDLARYVALVDEGRWDELPPKVEGWIYLDDLVRGAVEAEEDFSRKALAASDVVIEAVRTGIDPREPLPSSCLATFPAAVEWLRWEAEQQRQARESLALHHVGEITVAIVVSQWRGASEMAYRAGADVMIALNPDFRGQGAKYTVGVNPRSDVAIDLVPVFDALNGIETAEGTWGGRATISGSPIGSQLSLAEVLEVVTRYLQQSG